jgi:formate hydrogenlyase transcriptional activator
MRKDIRSIPSETMARMTRMPWPGNIRELQNVVERAVILTEGETLQVMFPEPERPVAPTPVVSSPTAMTLEDVERKALLDALRRAKGRVSGTNGAAALLGLKRTTFHSKMRRLNIERSDLWQGLDSRLQQDA